MPPPKDVPASRRAWHRPTGAHSLLALTSLVVAAFLLTVVGLYVGLVWYGRNTYGPENNHPGNVSEMLGHLLWPLLGASIAGFVALMLIALYWLAAFVWPRLRSREGEAKALKIGAAVVLAATMPLYLLVTGLD